MLHVAYTTTCFKAWAINYPHLYFFSASLRVDVVLQTGPASQQLGFLVELGLAKSMPYFQIAYL